MTYTRVGFYISLYTNFTFEVHFFPGISKNL
jgi:hypothetical protein